MHPESDTKRCTKGNEGMSRLANLTNDKAVKALKWSDGDPIQFPVKDKHHPGFYIRVSRGGTKTWFYQYKMRGKLRRLWFGRYPKVTCADAFYKYDQASKQVGSGIDPVGLKQAEIEFERLHAAREAFTLSCLFHDHYFPRYAKPNKRTWRNDLVYFKTKIEPVLGAIPSDKVTPDDIERLIRPMEDQGFNTARLTLAVIRKMYNWAVLPSSAETPGDGPLLTIVNPCRLYKMDKKNAPEPVTRFLNNGEIRAIWNQLGDSNADRILQLQLLTGCRVSEVAGMMESELDREAREWNLPARRNKTNRPLNIPLTERMLDLIGTPAEGHIFVASSKLGHTTVSGVFQSLQRHCGELGINNVGTHTMRRTFITNMARLGVSVKIRNRLTNHKDQTIDALYNQHDYLNERQSALKRWDRKLHGIIQGGASSARVVSLEARK